MKGKIINTTRKCRLCMVKFMPLSHNHIHCKECQLINKQRYQNAYNVSRRSDIVSVGYKYTHKKSNDQFVGRKQALKRVTTKKWYDS